jgi:putrescine transport system substrate-binding protein
MHSSLTRRHLIALGGSLGLAGQQPAPVRGQAEPLRILGWGHYFSEAVTGRFTEETGIPIEVTPIGAVDDVVLFLRTGGIGLYDLVAPTSGLLQHMAGLGLIQSFDDAAIPSIAGLFPQFRAPDWAFLDGSRIAVPVLWGSLAAVLPEEMSDSAPASWLDLMGEPFARRVLMSDDPLGHYWIWNLATGAADPTRVSREQLDATTELLVAMKTSQATSWDSSIYNAMRRLARGRNLVGSVGWQSAPVLSLPEERKLAVFHPDPGDASFCDNMALVAEAPHPEAALAFIDYMIADQTQADLMNTTNWATVTEGAVPLLTPEIAGLLDYANLDAHLLRSPVRGYPPFTDDGDDTATYFDWVVAWDRVRGTPVGG